MNKSMHAFIFHIKISFLAKANLKMMAFLEQMINYQKFNHMARIISHNNMYILEYIQETKQMTQFYFNMEEIQNNNFNKLYLEKEMSFLIVLN